MENSTAATTKKTTFGKLVTVIGIVIFILFFAWSATQIVKLFPSAVSSLASLADTVYNYRSDDDALSVISDRSIMNSSNVLEIWWENNRTTGTYVFSYECQDGIAIDIQSSKQEFTSISCDNNYDLGLVDRIEMRVDSEKARFTEVNYTIAYFRKNSSSPNASQVKNISIINANISETIADDTNGDQQTTEPEETLTTPKPAEEPAEVEVPTPTVPETPKPAVVKPTPAVPVYTYAIPVSNPNGFTDLAVGGLNIGFENNIQGFVKTDNLIKGLSNAIQFTVHNIGNKTSEDWIFKAQLPGNVSYTSDVQRPLLPNERAVITLRFTTVTEINLQNISIEVMVPSDINYNNNALFHTAMVIQ